MGLKVGSMTPLGVLWGLVLGAVFAAAFMAFGALSVDFVRWVMG